jgi:2-keto-4-pentenoate hydratase/2-oxohepta-3-ene-1,7-dioic acid hydratase in catechol pathway
MKFAAFKTSTSSHDVQVGIVSDDGASIQRLDLPEALGQQGVAAIVTLQAQGHALPAVKGTHATKDVVLLAPIPRPARNIFCVGKNYFEHAKEFAQSGFDSSATKPGDDVPSDPIIFSKVPECVVATGDAILVPKGVSEAID